MLVPRNFFPQQQDVKGNARDNTHHIYELRQNQECCFVTLVCQQDIATFYIESV